VRDKYVVDFAKKTNDLYSIVARKRIKAGQRDVSYKNKTCILDYGCIVSRKGHVYRMMVDIDTGLHVKVVGSQETVSSSLVNLVCGERMGHQIVKAIGQAMAIPWMWLVLGVVIGILGGYMIGQFLPMPLPGGGTP
jgi:hypothetical protein